MEDDGELRDLLVRGLRAAGLDAGGLSAGGDVLRLAAGDPPDLVVLDVGGVGARARPRHLPLGRGDGRRPAGGALHEDAARYAFPLATPIIGAAGILKLPDLLGPAGDGVRGRRLWAPCARRPARTRPCGS